MAAYPYADVWVLHYYFSGAMVVESVVLVGDKITPLSSDVPLQIFPLVPTPDSAYSFSSWSWGGFNIDYPKAIFSRLPSLSDDRARGWTDVPQAFTSNKSCAPKRFGENTSRGSFFFSGKELCDVLVLFFGCPVEVYVCLCVRADTGTSLFTLWLGSWNF